MNPIELLTNHAYQKLVQHPDYLAYHKEDHIVYFFRDEEGIKFMDNHFHCDHAKHLKHVLGLPNKNILVRSTQQFNFANEIKPAVIRKNLLGLYPLKKPIHPLLDKVVYLSAEEYYCLPIYRNDKIVNTLEFTPDVPTALNPIAGHSKLIPTTNNTKLHVFTDDGFIPFYTENQTIDEPFIYLFESFQIHTYPSADFYVGNFENVILHPDKQAFNTFNAFINLVNCEQSDHFFRSQWNGYTLEFNITSKNPKANKMLANRLQLHLNLETEYYRKKNIQPIMRFEFDFYQSTGILQIPRFNQYIYYIITVIQTLLKTKTQVINLDPIAIRQDIEELNNVTINRS